MVASPAGSTYPTWHWGLLSVFGDRDAVTLLTVVGDVDHKDGSKSRDLSHMLAGQLENAAFSQNRKWDLPMTFD